MTSTNPNSSQEADLLDLVIFGWRNRKSVFLGLCFGAVLAIALIGLKQRKSAGIFYQVKMTESLDDIYGVAPTGDFVVDLLMQEKWNTFFYSQLKVLTPIDNTQARALLDNLVLGHSKFGLSKNTLSSQGMIFSVRWPDEKIAAVLNPLLPKALNLLATAFNKEYAVLINNLQKELSRLQSAQGQASAEIVRLASKFYPEAATLLNNPLSPPREEGQMINFQVLVLIAGFIPETEPKKQELLDSFEKTQTNIRLLVDRRSVAFGTQSNTLKTKFIALENTASVQPIENENTAIRAQLWLTGIISVVFGGLVGLGVSGLRSYYLANRQRLLVAMNSKETEIVRGNG